MPLELGGISSAKIIKHQIIWSFWVFNKLVHRIDLAIPLDVQDMIQVIRSNYHTNEIFPLTDTDCLGSTTYSWKRGSGISKYPDQLSLSQPTSISHAPNEVNS